MDSPPENATVRLAAVPAPPQDRPAMAMLELKHALEAAVAPAAQPRLTMPGGQSVQVLVPLTQALFTSRPDATLPKKQPVVALLSPLNV